MSNSIGMSAPWGQAAFAPRQVNRETRVGAAQPALRRLNRQLPSYRQQCHRRQCLRLPGRPCWEKRTNQPFRAWRLLRAGQNTKCNLTAGNQLNKESMHVNSRTLYQPQVEKSLKLLKNSTHMHMWNAGCFFFNTSDNYSTGVRLSYITANAWL